MKKTILNNTVTIDDDFGTILVCAMRYALGRRTYMPKLVVDYITPLIPKIDTRALMVMQRDIATEADDYLGDSFDVVMWRAFENKLQEEIQRRGNVNE